MEGPWTVVVADLTARRRCAKVGCSREFIPRSSTHKYCLLHRSRKPRGRDHDVRYGPAHRRCVRSGRPGCGPGCALSALGVGSGFFRASRGTWGMSMVVGRVSTRGPSTLGAIAERLIEG